MSRNTYTIERGREFTINGEDFRPQGAIGIIGIKEHESYVTYGNSTYTFTADRDRHFEVVWVCEEQSNLVTIRAGCIKGDGTSVSFDGNFNKIFDTQYIRITETDTFTIEAENFKTVDDNYVGIWRNGSLVTNDSTYTFTPDPQGESIDIVWRCPPPEMVNVTVNAVWNYDRNNNTYDELIGTRTFQIEKGSRRRIDYDDFYSKSAADYANVSEGNISIDYWDGAGFILATDENTSLDGNVVYLSFERVNFTVYAGCVNITRFDGRIEELENGGEFSPNDHYVSIYNTRVYTVEKGGSVTINPGDFHSINDQYIGILKKYNKGSSDHGYSKDDPYIMWYSSGVKDLYIVWACNPIPKKTVTIHTGCVDIWHFYGRSDQSTNFEIFGGFQGYAEDYGTHTYQVPAGGGIVSIPIADLGTGWNMFAGEYEIGGLNPSCLPLYTPCFNSNAIYSVDEEDVEVYLVWACRLGDNDD